MLVRRVMLKPLRMIVLSLLLTEICACESDPAFDIPQPTGGTSAPLPPTDFVSGCDQAADGTACGEANLHKHCVFNVCAKNICGDGVTAEAEQCDDANDREGDGCSARCLVETGGYCGNGSTDGTEECDDGNDVNDDRCSNTCLANACRNGRLDINEECDDGNRTDIDACSNACLANACGNMRVDSGEECDDGNDSDSDACSTQCLDVMCGNNRQDPGELCDGGESESGVPCSDDCSGYGIDACMACAAERCSDYDGYPLYGGCRVAIPDGVPPITNFIEKCVSFDDCIRRSGCYDPVAASSVACYCGEGVDINACQSGATVLGSCIAEATSATACPDNDSVCVLGSFVDLTLPSGHATYLAQCRSERCATECATAN